MAQGGGPHVPSSVLPPRVVGPLVKAVASPEELPLASVIFSLLAIEYKPKKRKERKGKRKKESDIERPRCVAQWRRICWYKVCLSVCVLVEGL